MQSCCLALQYCLRNRYTSQFDEAWFWRELADALPSILDFLLSDDEGMVGGFSKALHTYLKNYYIPPTQSVGGKQSMLFTLVRKRDRASVLAWLASAEPHERKSLKSVLTRIQSSHEGRLATYVDDVFFQDGQEVAQLGVQLGTQAAALGTQASRRCACVHPRMHQCLHACLHAYLNTSPKTSIAQSIEAFGAHQLAQAHLGHNTKRGWHRRKALWHDCSE